MKFNWRQIYDFWGFALESLICYYLYRGNKRRISLEILRSIDYGDFIFSTIKLLIFSMASISLMMLIYTTNQRIAIIANTIVSFLICTFLVDNKYIGFGVFLVLFIFCFRFFLYKNSELEGAYKDSIIYINKFKRVLPLFFIFSAGKTILSFAFFHMLVTFQFTGLRFYLFIFMNLIFILAMTKKVMAEVVFLFLHKNNNRGIFISIFYRILAIGTITLSSLLRPVFVLMRFAEGEEKAMIYAIVHNETYSKSIGIVSKIKDKEVLCGAPVYIRRILYPYVFCSVFLARFYLFTKTFFYDDYELCSIIFYLHSIVIETFYTLQSTINFVLKTTPHKETKINAPL